MAIRSGSRAPTPREREDKRRTFLDIPVRATWNRTRFFVWFRPPSSNGLSGRSQHLSVQGLSPSHLAILRIRDFLPQSVY